MAANRNHALKRKRETWVVKFVHTRTVDPRVIQIGSFWSPCQFKQNFKSFFVQKLKVCLIRQNSNDAAGENRLEFSGDDCTAESRTRMIRAIQNTRTREKSQVKSEDTQANIQRCVQNKCRYTKKKNFRKDPEFPVQVPSSLPPLSFCIIITNVSLRSLSKTPCWLNSRVYLSPCRNLGVYAKYA